MAHLITSKGFLFIGFAFFFLLSLAFHQSIKKYLKPPIPVILETTEIPHASEIEKTTNDILNHIDKMFPKIHITNKSISSSAKNSKVYLIKPKHKYCIGEHITVQVDMYDYSGAKKTYGGDFLRARISTPELEAGSSGRIVDLNNGSYRVHFILFWEGKVNIEVLIMHPSEAASALWQYRNQWHGYVDHMAKFTNPQGQAEVICGFHLEKNQELCEFTDLRDEEYYYCLKPANFSCDSISEMKSWWRHDKSLLTPVEKSLFDKSDVKVPIPNDFKPFNVSRCKNDTVQERCKIGMKLEYPSGYAMKDVWYPKGCSMLEYGSLEELNTCMQWKFIHLFGDSTLRQWFYYIQSQRSTLKPFWLYEDNWSNQLLSLDTERNMKLSWKRHTFPFITSSYESWKEERTVTREIDLIRGDKRTVIILNIGVHFRAYPLYYFIKRLYNIRRAVERLFLRSPDTKVIIKTENTSIMDKDYETVSDFHALVHYFVTEIVFKDLNVGFVNGWDMTNAFDTNDVHPPNKVIGNEVKMLMTYIC